MIEQLKNKKGMISLVLHAHLPFVRHPEHERFLEEAWLFEGTFRNISASAADVLQA